MNTSPDNRPMFHDAECESKFRRDGPQIVQLIITVDSGGDWSVGELDARVPSGMGVILGDFDPRTSYPIAIKVKGLKAGTVLEIVDQLEWAKRKARGENG